MRRILVGLLLCAGCSSALDVDIGEFARLPDVADLAYSNIAPAQAHDYWELRYAFEADQPSIVGSGGRLTRDQLSTAQRTALDTTRAPSGFATSCLPGYCYKYIAAVNGAVQLFASPQALAAFLGPIDSMEEAALLAHARGLYWDSIDRTGYRAVAEGWQIVGIELVRLCAPVQTDRVLLLVRRNGSIQELGREIFEKSENACI
jgi:hypothetical protein